MKLIFHLCVTLLSSMLLFAYSSATAANFSVQAIQVCSSYASLTKECVSGSSVETAFLRSRFPKKRAFFSVAIAIGKDAIAYLREENHLPVIVKIWKNGIRVSDVDIGINFEKWDSEGASYESAVDSTGVAVWRTSFNVNIANLDRLYFRFDDVRGKRAQQFGSEANVEFDIEVTN